MKTRNLGWMLLALLLAPSRALSRAALPQPAKSFLCYPRSGPDPVEKRDFVCCNSDDVWCVSGQYEHRLSRKTISDHFGRNKSCTRNIQAWPLMCRKHYQRATYREKQWQIRKCYLIAMQFDRIEASNPGTLYKVSLKRSELQRLNQFARAQVNGLQHQPAASDKVTAFEAPIPVLQQLDHRLGDNRDLFHVKQTVALIKDMLEQGETSQVPSIEFLPQFPEQNNGRSRRARKVAYRARFAANPAVQAVQALGGHASLPGFVSAHDALAPAATAVSASGFYPPGMVPDMHDSPMQATAVAHASASAFYTAPVLAPGVTAPIPAPSVTAPIPSPCFTAPIPAPSVTAPIPAPSVTAPIPAPSITAPIPAPSVLAPVAARMPAAAQAQLASAGLAA